MSQRAVAFGLVLVGVTVLGGLFVEVLVGGVEDVSSKNENGKWNRETSVVYSVERMKGSSSSAGENVDVDVKIAREKSTNEQYSSASVVRSIEGLLEGALNAIRGGGSSFSQSLDKNDAAGESAANAADRRRTATSTSQKSGKNNGKSPRSAAQKRRRVHPRKGSASAATSEPSTYWVGLVIMLVSYFMLPLLGIAALRQLSASGGGYAEEELTGYELEYNPLGTHSVLFRSAYLSSGVISSAVEKNTERLSIEEFVGLPRTTLREYECEDRCIVCYEKLSVFQPQLAKHANAAASRSTAAQARGFRGLFSPLVTSERVQRAQQKGASGETQTRRNDPASVLRRLKCGHIFHAHCVDSWLVRMRKNSCPTCTRPVLLDRDSFMNQLVQDTLE